MTTFVLLAALLVAATMFLLTRPLFRADVAATAAPRQELEGMRDRLLAQLHELEIQRADQSMDPAVAGSEQARLEFELAQTLRQLDGVTVPGAPASPVMGTKKWTVAGVLMLALPLSAGTVYWFQNRATLEMVSGDAVTAGAMPPNIADMLARLEERLRSQPDDVEGWTMLGRSYAALDRPDEAKSAYAKAYALAPNDAGVVSSYAWLLFSENPERPTAEAVELYRKVLQLEPANLDAMWVLGLAAFHEGNYKQALGQWEKLHAKLPADSQAEMNVRSAIEEARGRLTPGK